MGGEAAAAAGATANAATEAQAAAAAVTSLKGDTVDRYIAIHTMKSGEYVSTVCAGMGLDFVAISGQISALNGITYFNGVQAGQKILIPTKSVPSGPYYRVMKHTLALGDTVYGLCSAYGIDLAANTDLLQRLNNKTNILTDLFYVGQTIYLPVYVAG